MRKIITIVVVVVASLGLCAQEFNKFLSVSSNIEIASNQKPILKPGIFSVPDGFRAVNFQFKFIDPLSEKKSSSLTAGNIFIPEKKTFLHKEKGQPVKEIYPGNYTLVIEGRVGACATLTYDLEPIPQENK